MGLVISSKTSERQDISYIGHFRDRTFRRTFHRQDFSQDISETGHWTDRIFHKQDILQTIHFIDRKILIHIFHTFLFLHYSFSGLREILRLWIIWVLYAFITLHTNHFILKFNFKINNLQIVFLWSRVCNYLILINLSNSI